MHLWPGRWAQAYTRHEDAATHPHGARSITHLGLRLGTVESDNQSGATPMVPVVEATLVTFVTIVTKGVYV